MEFDRRFKYRFLFLLLLLLLLVLIRIPIVDQLPNENAIDNGDNNIVENHITVASLLDRREYASNAAEELKNERECRQDTGTSVLPVRMDLNELSGRGED